MIGTTEATAAHAAPAGGAAALAAKALATSADAIADRAVAAAVHELAEQGKPALVPELSEPVLVTPDPEPSAPVDGAAEEPRLVETTITEYVEIVEEEIVTVIPAAAIPAADPVAVPEAAEVAAPGAPVEAAAVEAPAQTITEYIEVVEEESVVVIPAAAPAAAAAAAAAEVEQHDAAVRDPPAAAPETVPEPVHEQAADPEPEPEPEAEVPIEVFAAATVIEPAVKVVVDPAPAAPAPEPAYDPMQRSVSRTSYAYDPMLRSSSRSSFARSDVDIPAPLARSAEHGPPMPTSAVTGAVRATNPILDEILHSLALIRDNDPSMTTFDIKDCTCFTLEHAVALGEALKDNTFLKTLIMHNARLLTQSAIEIAKGLAINESVESADLSGNSIGPAGMRALAEMLETNRGLIELRLDHQKSITPTGTDAEQTFARSLAKNTTLQKLSLSIRDVASRNQIDRSIARNKDAARKLLAKQKSMLSVA